MGEEDARRLDSVSHYNFMCSVEARSWCGWRAAGEREGIGRPVCSLDGLPSIRAASRCSVV